MRRGGCSRVFRGAGKGASASRSRNGWCWLEVGSHKAAGSQAFGHLLLQRFFPHVAPMGEIARWRFAVQPPRWPTPRSFFAVHMNHSERFVPVQDLLHVGQKPPVFRRPLFRRHHFGHPRDESRPDFDRVYKLLA